MLPAEACRCHIVDFLKLLAIERDASAPVKVSVQGDALAGTLVLD